MCILVARDRTGKAFDFVTGRAPLTRSNLRRCLAPVVERDILLVTDRHAAYRAFSREAGALHVRNVNAYHSRCKEWLRRFHGVATR